MAGGVRAAFAGAWIAIRRQFVTRDAHYVRQVLARVDLARIATLPDGRTAATEGTVVAIAGVAPVRAPLSGRSCLYWELRFTEVGTGADSVERAVRTGATPFLLADATHSARIVADGAISDLPAQRYQCDGSWYLGNPRDELCTIASSYGVQIGYPSSILRASERIVVPGIRLAVRGWCAREPDPGAHDDVAGYREQLPTRPVLSGSRTSPLLIGTSPRAAAAVSPDAART